MIDYHGYGVWEVWENFEAPESSERRLVALAWQIHET